MVELVMIAPADGGMSAADRAGWERDMAEQSRIESNARKVLEAAEDLLAAWDAGDVEMADLEALRSAVRGSRFPHPVIDPECIVDHGVPAICEAATLTLPRGSGDNPRPDAMKAESGNVGAPAKATEGQS